MGKTTLARSFVPAGAADYFDLGDAAVAEQFRAPKALLEGLRGLVVIDEVRHAPELFRLLRVLMDRDDAPAKFLPLGAGESYEDVERDYSLTRGQVLTALRFAAHLAAHLPPALNPYPQIRS